MPARELMLAASRETNQTFGVLSSSLVNASAATERPARRCFCQELSAQCSDLIQDYLDLLVSNIALMYPSELVDCMLHDSDAAIVDCRTKGTHARGSCGEGLDSKPKEANCIGCTCDFAAISRVFGLLEFKKV